MEERIAQLNNKVNDLKREVTHLTETLEWKLKLVQWTTLYWVLWLILGVVAFGILLKNMPDIGP